MSRTGPTNLDLYVILHVAPGEDIGRRLELPGGLNSESRSGTMGEVRTKDLLPLSLSAYRR